MKKVFLIGDSILCGAASVNSPGYGKYVMEKLEERGLAEVYKPDENSRFAYYTLRYLHEWAAMVPAEEMDIVHWNNGLWDALHLMGDEAFTPIEVYRDTLLRIHKRIRLLFPKAKIVFATSTAVIESWGRPDFMRYNHEIEAYNRVAVETLAPLEVEINDLYKFTRNYDESHYADWVHFNEETDRVLADEVIRAMGFDMNR